MNVAILIIAFNRPDLFAKLLAKVLSVNPTRIYISIDGPRITKAGEKKKVEEVISIAKRISQTHQVFLKINSGNLGCGEGVSSAISWFFQNEEKGIILEDDCFPHDSFFKYCELLLDKYERDDRIGMISGNNFFFSRYSISESYFFSKYFHIWGWASWRRAWEGYQLRSSNKAEIAEIINNTFYNQNERNFWIEHIYSAFLGLMDTWDYQWVYLNFKNRRYSIMPKYNLISNIGFGEFATHTIDMNSKMNGMDTDELKFPLLHPKEVKTNVFTEYFSRKIMFRLSFWERIFFFLFRTSYDIITKIGLKRDEIN